MDKHALIKRTKRFALAAIQLVETLPRTRTADVLGRQLLRSSTSVGANYRSACRAKSKADFTTKMCIVLEEADECEYWLELLIESGCAANDSAPGLLAEARELTAIAAASVRTARRGASN